jgi:hypothetical protein
MSLAEHVNSARVEILYRDKFTVEQGHEDARHSSEATSDSYNDNTHDLYIKAGENVTILTEESVMMSTVAERCTADQGYLHLFGLLEYRRQNLTKML